MKKLLILLAALATAGPAFAQTPVKTTGSDANQNALHQKLTAKAAGTKSPAQKADRHASKMARELGLNADQEARVEKLMLARQQETAVLKTKYGTDKKAGRSARKDAHDRYEAQLKTILSAEQYTKLTQLKAAHHDKQKAGQARKVKAKV